jgi:hypothetical protein
VARVQWEQKRDATCRNSGLSTAVSRQFADLGVWTASPRHFYRLVYVAPCSNETGRDVGTGNLVVLKKQKIIVVSFNKKYKRNCA